MSNVLWAAASADERNAIAAAQWRSWPRGRDFVAAGPREAAVATARALASRDGAGYVVKLDVEPDLVATYPDGHVPAERLAELDAALVGAIWEDAELRGPISEREIHAAEQALGRRIPAAWRAYLQGAGWFRSGWMHGGAYVTLFPVGEAIAVVDAWGDGAHLHPGILLLGDNGSRELLAIDLREAAPRVVLVDIVSEGWDGAPVQAASIESFVARIEDGSFAFAFA